MVAVEPALAKCGWILPNGAVYACELGRHKELCIKLWQRQGTEPVNPELAAERAGWVKLTTINGPQPCSFDNPRNTKSGRCRFGVWLTD